MVVVTAMSQTLDLCKMVKTGWNSITNSPFVLAFAHPIYAVFPNRYFLTGQECIESFDNLIN